MFSAFSIAGVSQSSVVQNENYFVQEKIGEDFNQISLIDGNIKVIFHKDRIEMITDEDGVDDFFFIKLDNVSFDMPEGDGMVKRETSQVSNPDMAAVLGSATIEKSYFKTISYTDTKSGESIVVSLNGSLIELTGINQIPLELQLWGNAGESFSENRNVQLQRFGKTIEFSSNNCELRNNNNKISFKQNGGNDNTNLHLSISIL